jgi:hypothetical protein
MDFGQFLFQIFAQEAHQEINFVLRTAPIFERERIESERGNSHSGAGFDYLARRICAGAMSRDARQVTLLRPAAIAVHDDSDVAGQTSGVDLRKQVSFVALLRFEK